MTGRDQAPLSWARRERLAAIEAAGDLPEGASPTPDGEHLDVSEVWTQDVHALAARVSAGVDGDTAAGVDLAAFAAELSLIAGSRREFLHGPTQDGDVVDVMGRAG